MRKFKMMSAATLAAIALALSLLGNNNSSALAQIEISTPDQTPVAQARGLIPGQYIVVFNGNLPNAQGLATSLERQHGFTIQYRYQHALQGFSARMSSAAAAALANNPNIAFVEQDSYAYPLDTYVPAGVFRINADVSPVWPVSGAVNANSFNNTLSLIGEVDVDIAVIDSGIANDPDLNVVSRTNCSGGSPTRGRCKDGTATDGTGHGSLSRLAWSLWRYALPWRRRLVEP